MVGLAQPTIAVQPQSQTIVAGSTLTLSIEVSGTLPLVYQWQKDTGYRNADETLYNGMTA